MSKGMKLIKRPRQFFKDAIYKRYPEIKHREIARRIAESHKQEKPTAILIGFSDWKTWMQDILKDYNVVFMGHSPVVSDTLLDLIPKFHMPTVFVWSYKHPDRVKLICQKHGISLKFVEDGFLRSVGLGIEKSRPLSLVIDEKAMHFDAYKRSTLDDILNTHDFSKDAACLQVADQFAAAIINGTTKYMRRDSGDSLGEVLGIETGEKVVVVLGQVEDDLSIKFGAERFFSGVELVKIAAIENPHSRILYRPHPEALTRRKKHYSDPRSVKDICEIVGRRWSLNETLSIANRAYTVTSFAGFEATLRGIEVDLFGLPFYGGWGFTNDRHSIPIEDKRNRQLKPIEVLAGALVLYPEYFHPVTSQFISAKSAISIARSLNDRLNSKPNQESVVQQEDANGQVTSDEHMDQLVLLLSEFTKFLKSKAETERH